MIRLPISSSPSPSLRMIMMGSVRRQQQQQQQQNLKQRRFVCRYKSNSHNNLPKKEAPTTISGFLGTSQRNLMTTTMTTTKTKPSFTSIPHHQYHQYRMITSIPTVLESGAMGERAFDIYSRLLRERIICVHGDVTDAMASVVTAQLLFLEAEGPKKPVYMYINSPGGSVTAGLAIYDTMQYIQPKIYTIAMGQAASMGSLLLAGGSPNCRMALPNATIMLHQPSGGAQGMASDIHIAAQNILDTRERLNLIYQHHTGQSLEDIARVMDRDTFMDVPQALEFGIVDSVLTKRELMEDDDDEDDE